jgi:hypothetical protein
MSARRFCAKQIPRIYRVKKMVITHQDLGHEKKLMLKYTK